MELVIVRHAEPEWARDGRSIDDPPLTPRGNEQARHLARRLAGEEFDEVLVSPLRRAAQTAQPVIKAVGGAGQTADWLAEIRAPLFEGTPSETVEAIFREHRAKPVEEHWGGLDGGESFHDFHVRVTEGLDATLAAVGVHRVADQPRLWRVDHPGRRVLVVAHGGTNAVALGHLLGIPPVPWEWERFVSFHASVSVIHPVQIADAWSFSLFRFADIAHLPPDLQTR
jgi:2,3-bisphosphoglycerate-dependent phosphoglycerate mutase